MNNNDSKPKRIFLTGASGCIGHYVAEALIQQTNHELYFLVRDANKLKFDYQARDGINILNADLHDIDKFKTLLQTIDCAVLIATAWGGVQAYDINVVKTLRLMNLLDSNVCEQVIYFSTASILDQNNKLLKEAGQIGTDYIRTKYDCKRQLSRQAIYPKVTTVYPTLVLGGDANKPYSHLTSGLPEVVKWLNLIRFFKADASFHFIHARDIAQVVLFLIENPSDKLEPRDIVLGNQSLTVNQAVAEACEYFNKNIPFRIPLSVELAEILINLLRLFGVKIELAAWDEFCMKYRHFTYQNPVNPSTFGLNTYCPNFKNIFQVSGIPATEKNV